MSDQPPESFERQLSSQEERDVLLNFMGNTYGEIKKLDGNIVGASSTLQATKSEEVKRQIEKVFNEPYSQVQQPQVQPVPEHQPQVQPVPVHAPQVEIVQQLNIDQNQLSFNFDVNEKEELFELVNKVLTKLDKLNKKVDALVDTSLQITPVKKKISQSKKSS